MLEGCAELILELLNNATCAWIEQECHRAVHREPGGTPRPRDLAGPEVGRPSPSSEDLRRTFRADFRGMHAVRDPQCLHAARPALVAASLGDGDSSGEARSRWRLIGERTRDQSYKLDRDSRTASLTGDPEIDSILSRYRRPCGLGAA